jgi:hypothetical protein
VRANLERFSLWMLGFLVSAIIGFGYHWWSVGAWHQGIGFLSRSDLETMLISLPIIFLMGLATRGHMQTTLRIYGVILLVFLNPPIWAILRFFTLGSHDPPQIILFPIGLVLLLELILVGYLIFRYFKLWRPILIACLTLPSAFWGLWSGYFLWSYRPAVTLRCDSQVNLQLHKEEIARLNFNRWAARLEPVPKIESLPPVDHLVSLNVFAPQGAKSICQDKQAFDFNAAHYRFWLALRFVGKDGVYQMAQVQATMSEKLEFLLLGDWQNQKLKPANPNFRYGRTLWRGGVSGNLNRHFRKLIGAISTLPQDTTCFAWLKLTPTSELFATLDKLGVVTSLSVIRSGKLERFWNQAQILESLQRVAKRIGFGTISSWQAQDLQTFSPGECHPEKPYLGFQVTDQRFVTLFFTIEVQSGDKRFQVSMYSHRRRTPNLTIFLPTEQEQHIFVFLPEPNDIPWTEISTTEPISYTGSPRLPDLKPN